MTRALDTIALLFVFTALVACGGGGTDPEPSPSPSPIPSPTPTATPTPSPAPSPSPSPTPTGTNACYNAALYASGTTYTTAYTLSGSVVGTTSATYTVSAPTSYNGYSDLVAVNATEKNNLGSPTTATQTISGPRYYGIPSSSGVTNYGAVLTDSLSATPGSPDAQTYAPPFNDPISILSVGQSATANYVFTSGGTSVSSSQTWNYINNEDVTVPAGTFRATCHFRNVETIGVRTSTLDFWVAAGGGIAVKVASNGVTQVLAAAAINGVALR